MTSEMRGEPTSAWRTTTTIDKAEAGVEAEDRTMTREISRLFGTVFENHFMNMSDMFGHSDSGSSFFDRSDSVAENNFL